MFQGSKFYEVKRKESKKGSSFKKKRTEEIHMSSPLLYATRLLSLVHLHRSLKVFSMEKIKQRPSELEVM